jgi:hypothetical protein
MGRIILFMRSKLPREVSYDLAFLHQYTTKSKLGSVAIDIKVFGDIGHG